MTQATFKSAFFDRLKGPGGYYNIGNAFGFGVGLAVAVAAAEHGSDISTAVTVAKDYVAGSPAAVALTTATGVFFWGGEEYHRAWVNGFPPDVARNRRGDLLSGVGAVALGVGLSLVGTPLLAATSGFLHAAGKFGSALDIKKTFKLAGRSISMADVCRDSVLLSRIPAVAVTALQIAHNVSALPVPQALQQSILPATMLVCLGVWAKADSMLMSEDSMFARPARFIARQLASVKPTSL
jgi:hypothetical protein